MRKKRLLWNTVSSLVFQITTIICGFVLPHLILHHFGSSINGLVNSITQFLAVITFLELGVGAVVQSSLYKPLANKDSDTVSKIIISANKFFRNIARILLVYIVVLVIVYPFITNRSDNGEPFSWMYTAALIGAISISSFAQYYFGVVDRLLLTADQRGYIQYTAQTITLILNTVTCAVMINFGASIHMVKLTTSLIFLARPVFLRWYVNRNYSINRKIQYKEEPIKQKWNGIAQHVSAVVLDHTDTLVLTVLSTLSNVSIYSVYFLVVSGVKQLFLSMTGGIQALIGELWARKETDALEQTFNWFEWLLHTGTVFVFGCTAMLIVPFEAVYTNGMTDANYIQPLFGALLVIANAGHCLRLPYNFMILAAGHYKQTQRCYIIAVIINIVLSVVLVFFFGLVGVAIGTLVAMFYQTIWMALYNSKFLIKRSMSVFIKQVIVDILTACLAAVSTFWIPMLSLSYQSWILMAVEIAGIWFLITLLVNYFVYKDKLIRLYDRIKTKVIR